MFKVDDDTFVNPEQLWASLEHSLLHSATTKSLLPFFKKNQMTQNKESVITTAPLSESIDYLVSTYLLIRSYHSELKSQKSENAKINLFETCSMIFKKH